MKNRVILIATLVLLFSTLSFQLKVSHHPQSKEKSKSGSKESRKEKIKRILKKREERKEK